jgi:hypothetical protein
MKLFDLDTVLDRLLMLLGATAGETATRQTGGVT